MKYLKPSLEAINKCDNQPAAIVYLWLGVSPDVELDCKLLLLADYAKLLNMDLEKVKEALSTNSFTPSAVYVSTNADNPFVLVRGYEPCLPTLIDDYTIHTDAVTYYLMYSEDKTPIKISRYALYPLFAAKSDPAGLINSIEKALAEYESSHGEYSI